MSATATTTAVTMPTGTASAAPSTALLAYLAHRLRQHARTVFFWGLGIAIFSGLMIAVFPSFGDSGEIDRLLQEYPQGLLDALNFTSMGTIEGFLSIEIYSFLPLVLTFLPVTIFAGAIAGAEERRTLDVLLGNPLPRWAFVVATWLAVAILMLVMLAVTGLSNYGTAVVMDVDLSFADAMLAQLNLLPFTMLFGGVALLLSALVHQRSMAIGVSVALLFGMYLITIMANLSATYEPLRAISAFTAHGDVLQQGMPWGGFALLLVIATALAALAIPAFQRRDIYT